MSVDINLFGRHITVLTGAQMKALADAGHQVETVAISEVDKAVSATKGTVLGTAAVNAITAAEDPNKTGPQKFEDAFVAFLPALVHYLSSGNPVGALEADAIDFGRQFLQSAFNDFKSTTAGKVAAAVLQLVGA